MLAQEKINQPNDILAYLISSPPLITMMMMMMIIIRIMVIMIVIVIVIMTMTMTMTMTMIMIIIMTLFECQMYLAQLCLLKTL